LGVYALEAIERARLKSPSFGRKKACILNDNGRNLGKHAARRLNKGRVGHQEEEEEEEEEFRVSMSRSVRAAAAVPMEGFDWMGHVPLSGCSEKAEDVLCVAVTLHLVASRRT
jgi:hypothetical protein